MADKPRVLFYFLHLLGVGHVFRATRLIEGLKRHGFCIDVIYGGQKLPNVTIDADSIHYLSPIRATDNSYETILDSNNKPLDRPFQDRRSREILKIFERLSPDIVLTEAYPFGRRMVRYELQALLEAARIRRPRPLVVSSVRDILQERRKAERIEETRTLINRYFDQILVHSDPEIIKLDATCPLVDQI
ncbi:MAG: glycosyl transferase, partial [Rhizobiaceae bacterium]